MNLQYMKETKWAPDLNLAKPKRGAATGYEMKHLLDMTPPYTEQMRKELAFDSVVMWGMLFLSCNVMTLFEYFFELTLIILGLCLCETFSAYFKLALRHGKPSFIFRNRVFHSALL